MSCCDHQIPKVIDFSANKDRLFYFSDQGYFCIWKLKTLVKEWDWNFNLQTLNMVVCKKTPEVILVFEHDVKTFDIYLNPFIDYSARFI